MRVLAVLRTKVGFWSSSHAKQNFRRNGKAVYREEVWNKVQSNTSLRRSANVVIEAIELIKVNPALHLSAAVRPERSLKMPDRKRL